VTRLTIGLAALAMVIGLVFTRAASGDTVRRMSQPRLEHTARYVAQHGGVRGSCLGCATQRMRRLALELVWRAFPRRSRQWAVCIVLRESGANPGAVSPSHDFGLAQIHTAVWRQFSSWRLTHDPVYSVAAFRQLSHAGHNRQPWNGGRYAC